jgi:quinol monooxygenase YgiN
MIDITVVLTAKNPAALTELRELLAAHVNLSRSEPGCVRFEAYESQSESGTFVLIERWESQSALELHRTAQGFMTIYAPRVLPLVHRVPHICTVLPGT